MQEKLHEVVQPYSQLQRKKQPLIDQDDKHYDHPRLPKFKIVISRQFCLLGISTLHNYGDGIDDDDYDDDDDDVNDDDYDDD